MVAKAKIRANKRGLPFDIDALSVVTLWYSQAGRCYLSGRPMTLTPGPRCISLDRRDSSKGYTRKNTALAAVQINGMKSDLRIEEFLDWCEAVTLNREGGPQ